MRRFLVALTLITLIGCQAGVPAIVWNRDACDFCRMTISDKQYAAAATTAKGRSVRFDAVECLAGWVATQTDPPTAIWVTDAEAPGTLIPVAQARFFRARSGRSPMGKGFIAVAATRDLQAFAVEHGAGPFSWNDVQDTLAHELAAQLHTAASSR